MSSVRQKIIEHVLMGEMLRVLWRAGRQEVEVLRAEVDYGGYDFILESGGIVRHIQLKSSYCGARTAEVAIQTALVRKPSGCVLWVQFDPRTMALGPFLWYGGAPGQPLPTLGDRVARHSKGNSRGTKLARPSLRMVSKGKFTPVESIEKVVDLLFGASPGSA
jgi:hypothetical protein